MTKKPPLSASAAPAESPTTTPKTKGKRKTASDRAKPPAKKPKRAAGKSVAVTATGKSLAAAATDAREATLKMGRPTDYRDEYAKQAKFLCELGATDVELANFFDVNVSTIYLWSVRHADFSNAKKLGKQAADERVEQSLFKRAMGYEHDEIDIRTVSIGDGMSEIVKTPIRKHYPPDTTAMIFWLKNRRPAEWRDKIDFEGKVTVTLADRLKAMSAKTVPPHADVPDEG